MIVQWHRDQKTYMSRSFIGTIRTGETQNIKNWRTSLKVLNRTDIWDSAWAYLEAVAGAGKDLQAGVPVVERFEVEGKELAVVYGVIQRGITARGRVDGTYKFILCDAGEVLLLLAKEFRFKERLGA